MYSNVEMALSMLLLLAQLAAGLLWRSHQKWKARALQAEQSLRLPRPWQWKREPSPPRYPPAEGVVDYIPTPRCSRVPWVSLDYAARALSRHYRDTAEAQDAIEEAEFFLARAKVKLMAATAAKEKA